ncbi:MAG: YbjN domain-containing protein [Pseudomonadota bacterium]
MGLSSSQLDRGSHPVDTAEQVADTNRWSFERSGEDEIAILVQGIWTDYSVSLSWMEDFEALHVACGFDMRVPQKRLVETMRLSSLINEQMLFGHFDLWLQDGSVLYRHAIPLSGGVNASEAQIECLVENALTSCERYYQAFQFVVWTGKSATEALDSVLFDTVGEA